MGGIIWLASYPKSGNTWMRAFLHNLLQDPPAPTPINELSRFTLGDTMLQWYIEANGGPVDGYTDEQLAALRPKVHRLFTQVFPDSVFVKTHMVLGAVSGVPLISMEHTAGAIYILRDPRDVALSAASHFGTDVDGAIALMNNPHAKTGYEGINVPQYYGTWSQHVQSWTLAQHQRLLVVRYEDMLDKPFPTFSKVAKFLGLQPPPERIRKAIRFSSFRELQRQEARAGFIERSDRAQAFFRAGEAGQWKRRLSAEQIDLLVAAHGPVMREFGYRC